MLGPSGCGKTTLLNCIVGRTYLDSGSIQLKVQKRLEIGYMPQVSVKYFILNFTETSTREISFTSYFNLSRKMAVNFLALILSYEKFLQPRARKLTIYEYAEINKNPHTAIVTKFIFRSLTIYEYSDTTSWFYSYAYYRAMYSILHRLLTGKKIVKTLN